MVPYNHLDFVAQQVKSIQEAIIAMLRALPRQLTAPHNLLWSILDLIQTKLDCARQHHAHLNDMLETLRHDVNCIKQAMAVARHWFCRIPALILMYTN
ncbi:hypothetical protein AMAG_09471 [Allomyces macrogynus ATCC 38327]|uniref:Uncharacterized protein n=1 Tax=Allomyces macrogynus (strain ATCC 38327) TaxID=578462 RepID=A0A0L0SQ04_ALLM3|nr:hypothetical protein AMAG_09471 [Allomyces macrogynus ATCC 38327]|eukprot:KNE64450.1 hypothetical protein AMAG_09471 [Allomyces macrogynus ATCC 38327]